MNMKMRLYLIKYAQIFAYKFAYISRTLDKARFKNSILFYFNDLLELKGFYGFLYFSLHKSKNTVNSQKIIIK